MRPATSRNTLLALAAGLLSLAGCGDAGAPDDAVSAIRPADAAAIADADAVLRGAHIPTLDPVTLNGAEIDTAVGPGPRCAFHYTSAGEPVLAAGVGADGDATRGVVKLNGSLLPLGPAATRVAASGPVETPSGGLAMEAGPVRIAVTLASGEPAPLDEGVAMREATMVFAIGDELTVGYRGYWECAAP